MFGLAIDRPPVDAVRDFMFTDHPWLAADPTLGPWQETVDLDVVQTGAWILPDVRPLPAELVASLDARTPPVYVAFGSVRRVPEDIQVAIGHGWADVATVDERDDRSVSA